MPGTRRAKSTTSNIIWPIDSVTSDRRSNWTHLDRAMDVFAWLRGLGLDRYEKAFRENEVDARSLPHLTSEDLKDMGVTAIGHRRLLLQAIAALRDSPVTESSCA